MSERPLFLIGFMGSGKSTLGAALARRLGWDFVDTDQRVEELRGRTIEQIFREEGEAAFRRAEERVVADLDGIRRSVVATGGGLFSRFANRRRIKALGHTVWLDVPLETCAARVGKGGGRPLWDPSDRVGLRAFFDRRAALYALAESRFRVTTEDADESVGRLLAVFH